MGDPDALLAPAAASGVDLMVRHAFVITMDDDRRLIDDGAIAIAGRHIVAVGADAELAAAWQPRRTIDARGAPVHPGLVESHLHASYQTYRGAPPDHLREDDFFEAIDLPFYNTITDEDEHLACLLAAMEMIRNGTTCFMEAGTVLEPSTLTAAAERVGIRAVIGDAFIWDRPAGFAMGKETARHEPAGAHGVIRRAPADLDEALARLGHELRRNADPDALVTGHVAVLGLGTASEELLLAAKQQADDAGVVLNMHHAYSPADTAADRERYGKDPVVHLAEIGVLDRNVTLAHANHLTDAECEVLLERDTSIAWAPAASMMWAHGGSFHGRHAELWRRGGNVALGSDSANWSNAFDLFRQANLAMLAAREAHLERTYLVAEDVLEMATRAGAQAAGMADRIGSLEPGKRADLVIHTLERPEILPVTDLVRNLMYASGSKSVRSVIVDGRVVLEDGRFTTLDELEVLARFNEVSRSLLARMGYRVEPNRVAPRRRKGGAGEE